ncbi:MAG: hypothetical protein HDS88_01275 [Bacteroidales bacterium]|nr:hypothetical protein [Bacteroidales bacterium]MBD5245278.1 hypothetical protein [Barnesiella sp.]
MKSLLIILSVFSVFTVMAETPKGGKTCVKSEWQTPVVVYGRSKETCVQNNPDGSKTVTQTNCTTRGVSASVKGVGYKSVATQCEEPVTKTIPANSPEKSSSNNQNTPSK